MDWDELEASIAGCIACPLCRSRTRTVPGVGDRNADWLYIGEGPGAQEDATGEPFVGQAGKLLDNMLAAIDLKRGRNVFIANIVKCRPPGNREPTPYEARQCEPYLARQIELIKPKLIIALGKVAAQNLLRYRCEYRQPSRQAASAFWNSGHRHLSSRLSAAHADRQSEGLGGFVLCQKHNAEAGSLAIRELIPIYHLPIH